MSNADLFQPDLADVTLSQVMHALGDDLRLQIVATLAAEGERRCGTIELGVSKATRSHHFRVLREAGITDTRIEGGARHVTLRREELEARFPGLLEAILASAPAA
ncbi:MAG: ArsR/SmtB family transcription factor [Solirubrobacteraceae bacterium]